MDQPFWKVKLPQINELKMKFIEEGLVTQDFLEKQITSLNYWLNFFHFRVLQDISQIFSLNKNSSKEKKIWRNFFALRSYRLASKSPGQCLSFSL